MTSERMEPTSVDPQHDAGPSRNTRDLSASVDPPGATTGSEPGTTGFLFCLRCGTAMVGLAECPRCGFPRREESSTEYCL